MNKSLKTMMLSATLVAGLCSVSQAATITAIDSAAFTGTSTQTVTTQFEIRNNFYTNGGHSLAYLRFAVDSTAGTIGGVDFDDITAVSLDFEVLSYNGSNTGSSSDGLWALNDGITNASGLTETSWTEANFTRATAPHGTDVQIDTGDGVNLISSAFAFSGTGVKSMSLNVADFITFLKADTNDEISFGFLGENSSRIPRIASANNAGALSPTLTITAIPEPSSLALLDLALAGLLTLRRRKA